MWDRGGGGGGQGKQPRHISQLAQNLFHPDPLYMAGYMQAARMTADRAEHLARSFMESKPSQELSRSKENQRSKESKAKNSPGTKITGLCYC